MFIEDGGGIERELDMDLEGLSSWILDLELTRNRLLRPPPDGI
jgi:hypothetical protein